MYELKAFALIGALIDNTVATVAPIGELSPVAMTYAREKEYYSVAASPGHTLAVFSSKRDGKVEQTDQVLAGKLLEINKWAYAQALGGSFTSQTESFRTRFITQFGSAYSIYSTGTMVKIANNTYMPSSIEIRDTVNDDLHYHIWYSSDAFEQQFDEYEIKVVPPIDELDVFFQGAVTVQEALDARTQDLTFEQVQAIKEGYPETYLISDMFEWFNPNSLNDPKTRKPTYWNTVTYGIAGNNIDARKEALREFILANSTHTKDEWAVIFPEIFTATEFVMVPMWKNYSVTNKVIDTGIYSSNTNLQYAIAELTRLVRGEDYTDEWIAEHGSLFAFTHKCINIAVVGGPKNRDDIFDFATRYPDYIAIRSTETDFGRMAPETRKFVLALEDMMITAESMTPDSAVPVKYSRLTRDGILFLVSTIDKFQFLIVSKYSANDASVGTASDAAEPKLPS